VLVPARSNRQGCVACKTFGEVAQADPNRGQAVGVCLEMHDRWMHVGRPPIGWRRVSYEPNRLGIINKKT